MVLKEVSAAQNAQEMSQKDRKRHRQSDKFRRRMTELENLFLIEDSRNVRTCTKEDQPQLAKDKVENKGSLNAGEPSHF